MSLTCKFPAWAPSQEINLHRDRTFEALNLTDYYADAYMCRSTQMQNPRVSSHAQGSICRGLRCGTLDNLPRKLKGCRRCVNLSSVNDLCVFIFAREKRWNQDAQQPTTGQLPVNQSRNAKVLYVGERRRKIEISRSGRRRRGWQSVVIKKNERIKRNL